jgi:hypothetical protein
MLLHKFAESAELEGQADIELAISLLDDSAKREEAQRFLAHILSIKQKLFVEGLSKLLVYTDAEAPVYEQAVEVPKEKRKSMGGDAAERAKRRRAQSAYKRALVVRVSIEEEHVSIC